MAVAGAPKAFFSYVRHVDEHDTGRLTRLRERLQGEIRVQTGLAIEIYQDVSALQWGDRWEEHVARAAAGSLFLIPVVTPGYFQSEPCRKEYEAFRKMQKRHGIAGMVLPIYYVETEELSDRAWRVDNAWAEHLAAGQWADWRMLRFEPWESAEPNRRVEQMAKALKTKLKELGILRPNASSRPAPVPSKAGAARDRHALDVASGQFGVATSATEPVTAVGPSPLPTRREVIVDQNGRGHFRTVSDAVKATTGDDVIVVRPGIYRESVAITKSVTLLGDGTRDEIVLEAETGNVILFKAPFGRIANLTLRHSSTKTGYHAVSIRTGRLQLEGCDLSCAGLACVAISDDADPIVRRNRIHGGGKGGVLVSKGARGTIEDNDIFANTLAGIEIREEANPSIKRNRIRDSKGFGVLVQKRGRGIIEDNEVLSNTMFGFLIQSEADPCVRRNRIHTNRFEGVCVRTHGRGTFEDNDFRDNVRGAWDIAADCRHNVRRSGNIEK